MYSGGGEQRRTAINASLKSKTFYESWRCVNELDDLKIFPGTATVESDFLDVNYEKDQYRASLTDCSLEGILHAKQHAQVLSLKKSQKRSSN
jgi:hypothetical protein